MTVKNEFHPLKIVIDSGCGVVTEIEREIIRGKVELSSWNSYHQPCFILPTVTGRHCSANAINDGITVQNDTVTAEWAGAKVKPAQFTCITSKFTKSCKSIRRCAWLGP